jgi:hypothetical protein
MPRLSSLPERLRYLQPFRRKFKSRSPEELNEDTGSEPLLQILGKRLARLSPEEAEKTLRQDIELLEDWLAQLDNQNDCLQFVRGFFMVGSPSQMAQTVSESLVKSSMPRPDVVMELPPKAKMRTFKTRDGSGGIVRLKGFIMSLDVIDEEMVPRWAEIERETVASQDLTISAVEFGPVHGEKFIKISKTMLYESKDINYVLTVPGGYVYAGISQLVKQPDRNWDESRFEAYFHTLRVVEPLAKQNE